MHSPLRHLNRVGPSQWVAVYGHKRRVQQKQIRDSHGCPKGGTHTIHAANLIAHVPAVILMVALQAPMDASTIAAFKLVRRTGDTS